jgi:hypothetical protein
MSTKLKNKISRKIAESKRSAASYIDKKSATLRKTIAKMAQKLGVYNKKRVAQKKQFKKIFKNTFYELLGNKVRVQEMENHKNNLQLLSNISKLKQNFEPQPLISVEEKVPVLNEEEFTDTAPVDRTLFLKNLKNHLATSKIEWGGTKSKSKHPFITRTGHLDNIFTSAFFNEAIREESTITWKSFKGVFCSKICIRVSRNLLPLTSMPTFGSLIVGKTNTSILL